MSNWYPTNKILRKPFSLLSNPDWIPPQSTKSACYAPKINRPHLGLRFFIWAALQPGYRHSRFVYSQACNIFGIHQNPTWVRELMERYGADGSVVNVKMAKVVLNLCREAGDADLTLWVLRRMGQFGCRMDTVAYNVVIGLSREKGSLMPRSSR
ncbi:hypothetical protein Droror1_Dr00005072 [Drosera rotundifolia]